MRWEYTYETDNAYRPCIERTLETLREMGIPIYKFCIKTVDIEDPVVCSATIVLGKRMSNELENSCFRTFCRGDGTYYRGFSCSVQGFYEEGE